MTLDPHTPAERSERHGATWAYCTDPQPDPPWPYPDQTEGGTMELLSLTAKCVACKHEMTYTPPPASANNELPMCPKCFSPMTVTTATAKESAA